MKDAGLILRQKVYERLSGVITYNNLTISVYDSSSVPAEAEKPYILLSQFNATELGEGSKQSYGQEVSLLIEIYTEFGNSYGGKYACDVIANQINELMRTRQSGYLDLSPDWSVIRTLYESSNTLEELTQTGVLVRRLIRYTFKLYEA